MAALDSSLPADWAQLGFAPAKTFRMFGMRRSGNHAISSWILRNAPFGRSVFLNNCRAARSPLDGFASIEVNQSLTNAAKARRNMAGQVAPAGPDGILLVSYEDMSPADFSGARKASGAFDETLISAEIMVYRSFLNWAASLLRKLQGNPGFSLARRASIVLRTVERYARLLKIVSQKEELGVTGICYDDWFTSEAYRLSVLRELGLPMIDNSTGEVQRYGGGSSFDAHTLDANALQTGQRHRQMAQDPTYQAILHIAARDELLLEQLNKHFPNDAEVLRDLSKQLPTHIEVMP